MAGASTIALGIRDEEQLRGVLARAAAEFGCRMHASAAVTLTYFDTFDQRLGRAGLRLCMTADVGSAGYAAAWREKEGVPCRVRLVEPPRFASELPEGPVRSMLEEPASSRRLLPLVAVRRRVHCLDVLDGERKTVVRIEGRERSVLDEERHERLAPVLVVTGIRGYDAELLSVTRFLELRLGLRRLDPEADSEVRQALRRLGRDPERAVFRPVELDATRRSREAVVQVLAALFEVMLANEEGMRQDLDDEFLHEYRIALRRTRATLSAMRGVFPAAAVEHYEEELRWLGSVTGPLRDLDVMRTVLPRHEEELPPRAREELAPLRAHLEGLRAGERDRLLQALASERYVRFVANWRDFLERAPTNGTHQADAARPVAELVAARVEKRVAKLVKQGRKLDEASPDERFHALRIRGKRLRYLLETFRSLFPKREAKACIRALKDMQRSLGELNDVRVQVALLEGFARNPAARTADGVDCLLAAGRMIAHLERAGATMRARFLADFPAFADRRNQKRFAKLAKTLRKSAEG